MSLPATRCLRIDFFRLDELRCTTITRLKYPSRLTASLGGLRRWSSVAFFDLRRNKFFGLVSVRLKPESREDIDLNDSFLTLGGGTKRGPAVDRMESSSC
uniref:Uncharacterized protein n=1 Tax=Anopheles christyi TaxID=43041 RepID=A0A182KIK4_9DIPT